MSRRQVKLASMARVSIWGPQKAFLYVFGHEMSALRPDGSMHDGSVQEWQLFFFFPGMAS